MSIRRIHVEPARIEGALTVSIDLDAQGSVASAHVSVPEFRGFEAFLRGRHVTDAPIITPRICGVCPMPHHLASAKAIETGLGVEAPVAAHLQREMLLAVDHVADHILHLFLLAGPDILLPDLPPAERGLPTLYARHPEVVRDVLEVRRLMQVIISSQGVQGVHPAIWAPGGVTKALSEADRVRFLGLVQQAKEKVLQFHDAVLLPGLESAARTYESLGRLDTHFVGLTKDGNLSLYDGRARVVAPDGTVEADVEPARYLEYIAERNLDYSYAKQAFLSSDPESETIYRTGPIGRLNVSDAITTEHASKFLQEFRSSYGRIAQQTLALNVARYISAVYSIERAEQLLSDERIASTDTMAPVTYSAGEGVGIVEAPRGLLIHHFTWDDGGYIESANIITPTNANAYAIDLAVKGVAERSIKDGAVDEMQLEHEIGLMVRAYDPCLSCATHAFSAGADDEHFRIVITQSDADE